MPRKKYWKKARGARWRAYQATMEKRRLMKESLRDIPTSLPSLDSMPVNSQTSTSTNSATSTSAAPKSETHPAPAPSHQDTKPAESCPQNNSSPPSPSSELWLDGIDSTTGYPSGPRKYMWKTAKSVSAPVSKDTKPAESCPQNNSSPPSPSSELWLDGIDSTTGYPSGPRKYMWKTAKSVSAPVSKPKARKLFPVPTTQDGSPCEYRLQISSRGRVIKFRPSAKLYKNPPRPKSSSKPQKAPSSEAMHQKPASATTAATPIMPKFDSKHTFPQHTHVHYMPAISLINSLPPRLQRPVLPTGCAPKLMPKLSFPPNFQQESRVITITPAVDLPSPQPETKSELHSLLPMPTLFSQHISSLDHPEGGHPQIRPVTQTSPSIENQPPLPPAPLGDFTPKFKLEDAVQPSHLQKTSVNIPATDSSSPPLEHPSPLPPYLSSSTASIFKPINRHLTSTQKPQPRSETLNSSLELLANIASIVSTNEGEATTGENNDYTLLRKVKIEPETNSLNVVAFDGTTSAEVSSLGVTLSPDFDNGQNKNDYSPLQRVKIDPETNSLNIVAVDGTTSAEVSSLGVTLSPDFDNGQNKNDYSPLQKVKIEPETNSLNFVAFDGTTSAKVSSLGVTLSSDFDNGQNKNDYSPLQKVKIERETNSLNIVAVDGTTSAEVSSLGVTLSPDSYNGQNKTLPVPNHPNDLPHTSPTKWPSYIDIRPRPYTPLHPGPGVRPKLERPTVIPIQVVPGKGDTSFNPVTVNVNHVQRGVS